MSKSNRHVVDFSEARETDLHTIGLCFDKRVRSKLKKYFFRRSIGIPYIRIWYLSRFSVLV